MEIKALVFLLIITLISLLIILLSGWEAFGWALVALISCALIYIAIGYYIVIPYINWKDRKEMKTLENTIKEKEKQGYTEDELSDLKQKLHLLKKTHEKT